MATRKISALSTGTTANNTDKIPIERAGANYYITPAMLTTLIGGGGGGSSNAGLVARYHLTANLTLNNSTATVFNATIQDYDPGSAVTTGASWHYTVPTVTGTVWYDVRLSFALLIANSNAWQDGGGAEANVLVNGSYRGMLRYERTNASDGTGQFLHMGGSLAVGCVTGDTIQVQIFNGTGATRKMETDSAIEIYRAT